MKHKFNVCTGEVCATAFVDTLTLCGQTSDKLYQQLLEEFASQGVLLGANDVFKLADDVEAATREECAGMGSVKPLCGCDGEYDHRTDGSKA